MNIEVQNFLINSQSERIKLERQRLNLTQAQVAESVGVGKTTVINWEKEDGTSPNSVQMAKLLQMGFNILYILTGEVQENVTSPNVEQNSDFVLIPYYQMEISAGFGINSALGGTPKNIWHSGVIGSKPKDLIQKIYLQHHQLATVWAKPFRMAVRC